MIALAPADLITLAGFVLVVAGWGAAAMIVTARSENPAAVMRRRAIAEARRADGPAGAPSAGEPTQKSEAPDGYSPYNRILTN